MIVSLENRSLLRFMTAGSVDDGKSTLIGQLLYKSGGVYDDQLAAMRRASAENHLELDLSLITDGLRAEREQGITIDVAYRHFFTRTRKYIIADTPGHEQYTRNMATGASTADLVVILVDARKGVLSQTRRHALISWLFGIRYFIVAVNKMDLVNFDQRNFLEICETFNSLSEAFTNVELQYVPLSALTGENVIQRGSNMPWYEGPSLLGLLETAPSVPVRREALRFPVQSVIRSDQDFRGYAGQVVSGSVRPGQKVVAFPSQLRTTVKSIHLFDRKINRAGQSSSVILTLSDHIDLGRGDMLAGTQLTPTITSHIVANLIWTSNVPLRINHEYLIKQTTQVICGKVTRVEYKIDINSFEQSLAETLNLNEIGRVEVQLRSPIYCDSYDADRATGSFILIDPLTNDTAAAGMIVQATAQEDGDVATDSVVRSASSHGQGATIWFTGLSGAGKSTLCRTVETELSALGLPVEVIDGDVIRKRLWRDLGFSREDRQENVRRIAFLAHLLSRNGIIVLVSAISPYRADRDEARHTVGDFVEVFVDAPLSVCEARDPKGLYQKARAGTIKSFTGITDPYETPLVPEIVCDTENESVRESTSKVVSYVRQYLASRPRGKHLTN